MSDSTPTPPPLPQGAGVRKRRLFLFLLGIIALGMAIGVAAFMAGERSAGTSSSSDSGSSANETTTASSEDEDSAEDLLIDSAYIENNELTVELSDGSERVVDTGDALPFQKKQYEWNNVTNINEVYYEDQLRVSPDGTRVLFVHAELLPDLAGDEYEGYPVGAELWEYDVRTGDVEQLLDRPDNWDELVSADEYAVGATIQALIDVFEYSPVTGRYIAHDQCGFGSIYDTQTGENIVVTSVGDEELDYDTCGLVGGFPADVLWSTDESVVAVVTMFEGGYGVNGYMQASEDDDDSWEWMEVSDDIVHENLSLDWADSDLDPVPNMNRLLGILGSDTVVMARSFWADRGADGQSIGEGYTELWSHDLTTGEEVLIDRIDADESGYGVVHDMEVKDDAVHFSFYNDTGLDRMVRGDYDEYVLTEEGLERAE